MSVIVLGIRRISSEIKLQSILSSQIISWWHWQILAQKNGRHFADDIFKCNSFNENTNIFLKFVLKGPIDNMPALFWDNGLAPIRRRSINWINGGLCTDAYMHHRASLGYIFDFWVPFGYQHRLFIVNIFLEMGFLCRRDAVLTRVPCCQWGYFQLKIKRLRCITPADNDWGPQWALKTRLEEFEEECSYIQRCRQKWYSFLNAVTSR